MFDEINEIEHYRYQIVADVLKAAVIEWNLESKKFYCSKSYYKYAISQYDNQDILYNRGINGAVHPDDVKNLRQFFQRKDEKKREEVIVRLKLTNGLFHWCRIINFYDHDISDKPVRVIGIIVDINEEHEKTFMLDNLINELPGGVAVFGFKDRLCCEYFSDGFAELCGLERDKVEELISKGLLFSSLLAPADYEYLIKSIHNCVSDGQSISLNFRFIHKDQSIRWLHLSAAKMREENGIPIYYCIFSKPSEETNLYRDLVEDSVHGVLVAECQSRKIIYINEVLKQIYEQTKIKNMNLAVINDIIPRNQMLLSEKEISLIEYDSYKVFHVNKNGFSIEIRAKKVKWNNKDSFVLFFTDETIERSRQLQLQNLIDNIPGGVGIFDVYGGKAHQVYLNDSFYQLISDKRENRVYDTDTDFMMNVHPDDFHILKDAIHNLENGEEKVTLEYRTKDKREDYIYLRLDAKVISKEKGIIRIYCCFTNISDMVKTREELLHSNAIIQKQYKQELERRKILERGSFVSVCINITQDMVIGLTSMDPRFQNLPKQFSCQMGREIMTNYIPSPKDRIKINQLMQSEYAKELVSKGIFEDSAEYRSYQSDGSLHWIRVICNITKDMTTNEILAYAYYYDIDKEKKSQLSFNKVIDNEIDYVMLYSVSANKARFVRTKKEIAYNDLNDTFDLADIVKTDSYQRIEKTDQENVRTFLSADQLISRLNQENTKLLLFSQINKKNEIRRKKLHAFYLDELRDDIIIIRRDITDIYQEEQVQKQMLKNAADEANHANRAKSDFLARMSHDMRTPMNGILGLAELSSDENNLLVIKDNNEKILQTGKYLLGLINDTLDFQKIESGKMKLEERVYDIETLISGIYELIHPQVEKKNIELVFDNKNAELSGLVILDPIRITQIFVNILSNAIKFTPEGGKVTLEFLNLGRTDRVSHNRIRVIDTGIGISKDFINHHLFKPFEQEKNDVSVEYVGSGLGLAIVNSLVQVMNGRIEVDSEIGIGTTFTIYLDFLLVKENEVEVMKKEKTNLQSEWKRKLTGKHILLVEDHPLNAQIAEKLLIKQGCEVNWAPNGEKGVQLFKNSTSHYYDLIFMDIRMPVMDGLEAARSIRALQREDAKEIPIIAMTANAYEEDVKKSFDAGMNEHLAKPIVPTELYDTIVMLLK